MRLLLPLVALGILAGCPSSDASCPLGSSFVGAVAAHVVGTIKLNTQSDCAGYSRANTINGVANDQAIGPDRVCEPDPTDDDCVACLRPQCCDAIAALCFPDGGSPLDPVACASVPAVNDCLVTAAADACAPACGRDA